MSVLVVGLNHRTAPVEVREEVAFGRESVSTALMVFKKQFPGCEAAILSTCNRVEIIVASPTQTPDFNDIVSFIAQARDLPAQTFKNYLYQFSDEQGWRHFFRVVSGLDSMVLGEDQIVNQAKQAYALASEQGTTGRILNRLFHQAFSVSKRIRTETTVAEGKLSVASVAVDVAKQIFSDFTDKKILIIGAGETARLVCQHLMADAQVKHFTVMSRTLTNARALAEVCNGVAVPYDQLDKQLIESDIVITAMACPQIVLTQERMKQVQKQRHGRLMFLIDLAVPRNIAPDVAEVSQVYLHDIDTLGRIVAENQKNREQALTQCEKILDDEVGQFEQWLGETALGPLIAQAYSDARRLRDAELQRLMGKCPDLTEQQQKAITQLVDRLVGKFMHPCTVGLRNTSGQAALALVEALRAFNVDA